jgi:hypothetical protein
MSHKYNFISLETVLAKFRRELRNLDIHENDAIEWAGEALGFMKIPNVCEEAVLFGEVKDHHLTLPPFHNLIQVARHNDISAINEVIGDSADLDTQINLQWDYLDWLNQSLPLGFYPVSLADHSFFDSIVCKEDDERIAQLYKTCKDEYTVVQDGCNRKLRLSFKEGFVAVAYRRQITDSKTGYPMIPDNEYCINAISYYMKWKFWERYFFEGRDGSQAKMEYSMLQWDKYIRRFKGHAMMPFGLDQYENLKNQSSYLIPRRNRADNFFGELSNKEFLPFKRQ